MSAGTQTMFNFRAILRELGIPSSNETNWAAGQVLRKLAYENGFEPARLLTDKTDPDPTVAAQHCIAHYDLKLYPIALAHFRARFEEERRQFPLFDPPLHVHENGDGV